MTCTGGTRELRVCDYYRDQTVLLTGFTGYLGKLLVEKLLWSCPDLRRIYVLVRSKKGSGPHDRTQQILSSSLAFERLRQHHPERLEKVVGVSGDLSQKMMGLSAEDADLLVRETSVVIHCAATVRFDESLPSATRTNILGTLGAVQLASTMKNLKCFNHVSTAYVNCDRKRMGERLYPAKMDWRDLVKIAEKVDEATLNALTSKLLGVMPNTYVFTKSLAEQLVVEHAASCGLPALITRPSVVMPAEKEPSPGWVDSLYGPIGLNMAGGFGAMRVLYVGGQESAVNYVFSDQVVRATLSAPAAPEDVLAGKEEVVPVYNLCSPESRVFPTLEFWESILRLSSDHFVKLDLPYPVVYLTRSSFFYQITFITKHLPSAFFADTIITMTKRKPILTPLRRKLYLVAKTLNFFIEQSFQIDTDNYERLNRAFEGDEDFYTDLDCEINFGLACNDTFERFTKMTVVKDLFEDLGKSRKFITSLYYFDKVGELLCYILVAYFISSFSITKDIFSCVADLYQLFLQL